MVWPARPARTGRVVGAAIVAQSISYLALVLVWPLVHGEPAPVATSELTGYPIGYLLSGCLMHAISQTAIRHERGAARERSLAKAGRALVGASTRAEVYTAALDAIVD